MISPYQEITVGVPTERVGEFYEMFGRWLQAPGTNSTAPSEMVAQPPEPLPFGKAEDAALRSWWKRLKPAARRIFAYLADRPEERIGGPELANACRIAKGPSAVAGTLSWPGRHATRLGLDFPLGWDGEVQKYWMPADVAQIIHMLGESEGD